MELFEESREIDLSRSYTNLFPQFMAVGRIKTIFRVNIPNEFTQHIQRIP